MSALTDGWEVCLMMVAVNVIPSIERLRDSGTAVPAELAIGAEMRRALRRHHTTRKLYKSLRRAYRRYASELET